MREVSGEVRLRSCSAHQEERFGSVRPSWKERRAEEASWAEVRRGELAAGHRLVLAMLKLPKKSQGDAPKWGSWALKISLK